MKSRIMPWLVAVCWTLVAPVALQGAPVSLFTDRTNAIYQVGETVSFRLELSPESKLAKTAEFSWEISKDGALPIHTGTVCLVEGKASISGKLSEPGFLLCRVQGQGQGNAFEALAGAAIDPLAIAPSLPVPEDFDAFWKGQKARLATVPMNPQLAPVGGAAEDKIECFDVKLECAGPAPVSGYYARPRQAQPKSLPIILLLHGAGVQSASLANAQNWCRRGFLAMDINAHGISNGQPAQFYRDLEAGKFKGYPRAGRESREEFYFLGMFLRGLRAIDFLARQPEWDGKTLIAYGSSQGGFQAFALAGLDERVSFIAAGVPAGCDHTGVKAYRISGWPKVVPVDNAGVPDESVLQVSRYFDCVNFASRAKAKGAVVTVGFIDRTCPPTSVYAAYNRLPIPKAIFNDLPTGHANSPAAMRARDQAVMDHVAARK